MSLTPAEETKERITNAIAALPKCPPGFIRLYRATVLDSESVKKKYDSVHTSILDGTFKVDSLAQKALADKVIAHQEELIGGFYSDSLEAALPYFLRFNEDPKADRVLNYIDVPEEKAKRFYFGNINSTLIGAVHHKKLFAARLDAKRTLYDMEMNSITGTDPGAESRRQDTMKSRRLFADKLRGDEEDMANFSKAFTTCKFEDMHDEFYLPYSFVTENKKEAIKISSNDVATLNEPEWKSFGTALNQTFYPDMPANRIRMREFTPQQAVEATFDFPHEDVSLILHPPPVMVNAFSA